MGHEHTHTHHGSGSLKAAFFLNLGFTLLELVGGLLTNSVAIISDALHDLGDTLSLGMSWYLSNLSEKGGDRNFSYGYRRFSLLGALINAAALIVGGVLVLSEAVPRLMNPEPTSAPGMIALALVGIGVNGLAAWRLRSEESLNARMVGLHLLEDVLGWVAVLVVSIVLLFSDLYILDPLLSVLITALVLYRVISRLRETGSLFLQGVPGGFDLSAFEAKLRAIDHVIDSHHTHVWSLDGQHHVLTTHLIVPAGSSASLLCDVKSAAIAHIDQIPGMEFEHTTIEIEFEDEPCRQRPEHG
jgi:cobalt-zinc-cadmium efflux system protein